MKVKKLTLCIAFYCISRLEAREHHLPYEITHICHPSQVSTV